jgi:hypothetical protein
MDGRGLIGIVSGLGPLAGSDVLEQALTYAAEAYGATEDAEYPDIVLFSRGIEDFDATGERFPSSAPIRFSRMPSWIRITRCRRTGRSGHLEYRAAGTRVAR